MAEWLKAHAWKACVGKTTVGSNPTLSAILLRTDFHAVIREGGRRPELIPDQNCRDDVSRLSKE